MSYKHTGAAAVYESTDNCGLRAEAALLLTAADELERMVRGALLPAHREES